MNSFNEANVIGTFLIGASAVLAMFLAVGKPIINLTTTIVKLDTNLEQLTKQHAELEKDVDIHLDKLSISNSESHHRIWDKLEDHEERINKLEK